MTEELGKLERVELRSVWAKENTNFTTWLAEEKSLELLGETIGMSLELEKKEKEVGSFSADILCKNVRDDSWVVIENQLEKTDHKHLGQVLTYGAGLDAFTMVWVAARFTEEHRAALDWLNRITGEGFRFFGLEVEAWKIDDSRPAPKFNIISKPNNWSKAFSREAKKITDGELAPIQVIQLRYWQQLEKYLQDEGSKLNPQTPKPRPWQRLTIGVASVVIDAVMNTTENKIRVELNIHHSDYSEAYFNLLLEEKEAIENETGFSLVWRELQDKKSSKITIYKDANPKNEKDWGKQHAWLKEMMEVFDNVFGNRVRKINPDDWNAPD